MTDTERIDKLERLIWSGNVGNGIAIFPSTNERSREKHVVLQDLGEEDGTNLGEELTETKKTLREAIDAVPEVGSSAR